MKKQDRRPQPEHQNLPLPRRLRLEALLFAGAAATTAPLTAGGELPKMPPAEGE